MKAVTGRGRRIQGIGFVAVQKASRSAAEVSSSLLALHAPAITPSHYVQVTRLKNTHKPVPDLVN